MPVIRAEQQEALRQYMLEQYVDRAYEHFLEFFPRYCEIRTEPAIRDLIRYGVERAKGHEIVGERNVLLYTTLMLVLGCHFDDDPQYRWAAKILDDKSLGNESDRADRLFDTATEWLDRVAGKDHQLMGAALLRLRGLDLDEALGDARSGSLERRVTAILDDLYPSKSREVEPSVLAELCRRGRKTGGEHGLVDERGAAVVIGLMFMLGAGCVDDPQHPWIGRALGQPPGRDARPRADELFGAAIEHVAKWLD